MSTKTIVPISLRYTVLKIIVLGFAAMTVLTQIYYWYGILTGTQPIEGFQVATGQTVYGRPDSGLDFVLTTLTVALLTIALIYAYRLIQQLEPDEPDYSAVIRHLARFATALCLYAIGSVFSAIIMASIDIMDETGEFGLALLIDTSRITLLMISVVLFMVTKALHAADEAVEETQNFL